MSEELPGMLEYTKALLNPSRDDPNWPLPSFYAKDWAEAFCKRFPSVPEDEALTWFANALMRGYDEAGVLGVSIIGIDREKQAERDELKNVVNALEKEVSAYADSLLEALRERDRLREALILFYELLSALHKDLINSGRRSPIPMKAVEAKYKKALEGREEG